MKKAGTVFLTSDAPTATIDLSAFKDNDIILVDIPIYVINTTVYETLTLDLNNNKINILLMYNYRIQSRLKTIFV